MAALAFLHETRGNDLPALVNHVVRVFFIRNLPKVLWPYAWWIVTDVRHDETLYQWSDEQFIRSPMGPYRCPR